MEREAGDVTKEKERDKGRYRWIERNSREREREKVIWTLTTTLHLRPHESPDQLF